MLTLFIIGVIFYVLLAFSRAETNRENRRMGKDAERERRDYLAVKKSKDKKPYDYFN